MGLRETLEAATPGPWELDKFEEGTVTRDGVLVSGPPRFADAALIALAPELAALALDMGDLLRGLYYRPAGTNALLARLDQIGKEQT